MNSRSGAARKKILFVINTMGKAGAETALLSLLRSLLQANKQAGREGCELYLYVLTGQGELIERIPPGVQLLNRRYKNLSVLSGEGRRYLRRTVLRAMFRRGALFRQLPNMILSLAEMIKKGKIWPDKLLWRVLSEAGDRFDREFDLAVAFLEGGATYYVADHVKARKKAAFIHVDYSEAGYTRQLDQSCYLGYDAVFPISNEVKDSFLRIYPECAPRTRVFHNIIDRDEVLRRAAQGSGFSDSYDGIRLLTVGRLTWQKAYPTAITAMTLLKQAGVKARWYILGEGSERKALERQIESAGLREDFVLLGAVDNPYPYYAGADIYVHATRFEGKSIAIQEAQILGRPIIASDSSGNREQIVHDVDGLLCPLEPSAIRDAVLALISDPERRERLGRAAGEKRAGTEDDLVLLEELVMSSGERTWKREQERTCW